MGLYQPLQIVVITNREADVLVMQHQSLRENHWCFIIIHGCGAATPEGGDLDRLALLGMPHRISLRNDS